MSSILDNRGLNYKFDPFFVDTNNGFYYQTLLRKSIIHRIFIFKQVYHKIKFNHQVVIRVF